MKNYFINSFKCLLFLALVFLVGCQKNPRNTTGVPVNVWTQLTPAQRQELQNANQQQPNLTNPNAAQTIPLPQ